MSELSTQIGKNIRLLRKKNGLSVAEFARRIGKSVPTVYKYETGSITIDVDTLSLIAEVFHLSVPLLIGGLAAPAGSSGALPKDNFFNSGKLYGYNYDGRENRIIRSLLTFFVPPDQPEGIACAYYLDLSDFSQPETARYIYVGSLHSHEILTYFIMENVTLRTETYIIELMHPIRTGESSWGLFLGFSDHPYSPMAGKTLFSKRLISDEELRDLPLRFTKEEIRNIRSLNGILLLGPTARMSSSPYPEGPAGRKG